MRKTSCENTVYSMRNIFSYSSAYLTLSVFSVIILIPGIVFLQHKHRKIGGHINVETV